MIASGDKRRQVASGVDKSSEEVIREEKRIEGTMRVITPGDKRRQVASGSRCIREGIMRAIAPGSIPSIAARRQLLESEHPVAYRGFQTSQQNGFNPRAQLSSPMG